MQLDNVLSIQCTINFQLRYASIYASFISILGYWKCLLSSGILTNISTLIWDDLLTYRIDSREHLRRAFTDVASGTLLNMARILILRATFQRHQTHPRDGLYGLLLSLVVCATTVLPTPRCCSSSRSRFMFMFYGSFILNLWHRSFYGVLWFRGCKRSGRFMSEIGIKIGVVVRTTRRYITNRLSRM